MRLLPRAPLTSVLTGSSPVVGSRARHDSPRGWISPVEARALLGIEYVDLRELEEAYLASPDRSFWSDAKIVARALIANALVPERELAVLPRPYVVSARVDNVTIAEAVDRIAAPVTGSRARIVHFAHAHLLNLAHRDRALARMLAAADATLPDGIGVRLAARMQGVLLQHNVNGTDLFPLLCARAARDGIPLVLIGAAEGVAEDCAARVRAEHPGIDVPFVSHGYLDDEASRALGRRIRELDRAIVMIGMGSPLQERWAWRHLATARGITALTVGGLFDMVSGRVPRAPTAWRETGFEWAWRMAMEPRRMIGRYLLRNPLFLARAITAKPPAPRTVPVLAAAR